MRPHPRLRPLVPEFRPVFRQVTGQALALAALLVAGTLRPFAGAPVAHGLPRWLARAAPADAVAVVAHRMALLVALWLALTTLAHLAAVLAGVPALVRVTARAALPGVRRSVAVLALTSGLLAPGAASAGGSEAGAAAAVRDGRAAPPAAAPAAAPPATAPGVVVVEPGDSLWSIAARVTAPGDDVGRRWAAICAANADRLRSGDLSLVYPGEEVVVPD